MTVDVLHVTHQFAPETHGGVEAYVLDVGSEQRARGLDVRVLTGSHAGWPEVGIEALEGGPLPVHRLHRDDQFFDYHAKTWHPVAGEHIVRFVEELRPRVVHLHQWIRMTSNLVELLRGRGFPVVITLHDFYTSCPRAFRLRPDGEACRRPLSVASCLDCVPRYGHEPEAELAEGIELFRDQCAAELAQADAVLVAAASTADLIAATTTVPRERFTVLPLGYRPRYPGQGPLPAPAPGEALRFAFWGGVAPHKGVDILIDAFRALVERVRSQDNSTTVSSDRPEVAAAQRNRGGVVPAPYLHVLGGFATPGFEAELRARAEGLPVTFHGRFAQEELRAVAPHVGVFPSTCLETHGLVLDECFEFGLPSIVSKRGVLAERAGASALSVEPGDARDLAAAMARLLDEPELWGALHAALPPPSPSLAEHCDALQAIYECAGHEPGALPGAVPLPESRRVRFLLRQRESALALIPPEEFA